MSQERQGAFSRVAVVNRGEPAMRLINAVREWNAEGRPALRVIAVYTAEVAGARRAAVVDRRRGELRIPPVAEHEARPAVADLAFGAGRRRLAVLVGDLEHDPGERSAVGGQHVLKRITSRARGHQQALRPAVDRQQCAAGHLL